MQMPSTGQQRLQIMQRDSIKPAKAAAVAKENRNNAILEQPEAPVQMGLYTSVRVCR